MANKRKSKKRDNQSQGSESALLDMSNRDVKKMIKAAKSQGFVTYEQLNKVTSAESLTSEQIEDVMSMLSEMGINVIENDEDEQSNEITPTNKKTTTERADRTDDPVRMYLREMGSVDLLSREGEIAIAKRIEAGKEAMIEGLCESPLTFQAIIIWRDELNEGQVLLRDIIDLEASYEGPDAKNKKIVIDKADEEKKEKDDNEEAESEGSDSDSDYDNNLSLAAMEAELKPDVFDIFDSISNKYKKLRKLQDKRNEFKKQKKDLTSRQLDTYNDYSSELKDLM